MLTDSDKDFIKANHSKMTVYTLARAIGCGDRTIRNYMNALHLEECSGRKKAHIHQDFVCRPPESCFSCPHSDCVKSVSEVKRTKLEDVYSALGFIDSIGKGNGRRRV